MMSVPVNDITNDTELAATAELVGAQLQLITNYLNENPASQGRIRFPRGYLGTVSDHSRNYRWVKNSTLKRNLSYQYVFFDVLRWLCNRTDVYGTAREMIFKHAIVVLSSIAEGLLSAASRQLKMKEAHFKSRTKALMDKDIIAVGLKEDLIWLWTTRGAIHLEIINDVEWDKYKIEDVRRATKIVKKLEEALSNHFSE